MRNYKQLICGIIIGATATVSISVLAEYIIHPNPYPIKVNGEITDIEGYNINDSTYFKLRDIGEKVGFSVDFANDTINVSTATPTPAPTATPTPIPLSEIPPEATKVNPKLPGMGDADGLTSDGIPYDIIDGVKYVSTLDIDIVYDVEKYFFGIFPPNLIDKHHNNVLTNIEYAPDSIKHNKNYIPVTYYETILKPYLQEHCK